MSLLTMLQINACDECHEFPHHDSAGRGGSPAVASVHESCATPLPRNSNQLHEFQQHDSAGCVGSPARASVPENLAKCHTNSVPLFGAADGVQNDIPFNAAISACGECMVTSEANAQCVDVESDKLQKPDTFPAKSGSPLLLDADLAALRCCSKDNAHWKSQLLMLCVHATSCSGNAPTCLSSHSSCSLHDDTVRNHTFDDAGSASFDFEMIRMHVEQICITQLDAGSERVSNQLEKLTKQVCSIASKLGRLEKRVSAADASSKHVPEDSTSVDAILMAAEAQRIEDKLSALCSQKFTESALHVQRLINSNNDRIFSVLERLAVNSNSNSSFDDFDHDDLHVNNDLPVPWQRPGTHASYCASETDHEQL